MRATEIGLFVIYKGGIVFLSNSALVGCVCMACFLVLFGCQDCL
jgi:hypothetical protein